MYYVFKVSSQVFLKALTKLPLFPSVDLRSHQGMILQLAYPLEILLVTVFLMAPLLEKSWFADL